MDKVGVFCLFGAVRVLVGLMLGVLLAGLDEYVGSMAMAVLGAR